MALTSDMPSPAPPEARVCDESPRVNLFGQGQRQQGEGQQQAPNAGGSTSDATTSTT